METDTKTSHTPGPWMREKRIVFTLAHAGWRRGVEQFSNWFSAHVQGYGGVSPEELEANARLIAAAPDLLVCCKAALLAFETNAAMDWSDLRYAIDKAEGK